MTCMMCKQHDPTTTERFKMEPHREPAMLCNACWGGIVNAFRWRRM